MRRHVERAGRAMVVSEGIMTAGVAAASSARIREECFDFLHQPVIRAVGEGIPIALSNSFGTRSVPTLGPVRGIAERLTA